MDKTVTLRHGFMVALHSLVPLALRVIFGFSFAMAGWMKFSSLQQTITGFAGAGIPFANVMAPFVAGVELVGGLMLIAGFATRIASFFLAFTMVVAFMTAHHAAFAQGLQAVMSAAPFPFLLATLVLLTYGAGPLSVDFFLKKKCFCGCSKSCCSCTKTK